MVPFPYWGVSTGLIKIWSWRRYEAAINGDDGLCAGAGEFEYYDGDPAVETNARGSCRSNGGACRFQRVMFGNIHLRIVDFDQLFYKGEPLIPRRVVASLEGVQRQAGSLPQVGLLLTLTPAGKGGGSH